MSVARRRELVAPDHVLPVVRQCQLLSISRSGFYYVPCGESAGNLGLMRLIDEQFSRRVSSASVPNDSIARLPATPTRTRDCNPFYRGRSIGT